MPTIRANGLDLCYERIGDPSRPAILLIMGLGTQMIAWPDAFCGLLADRGFQVLRFDNRDVGLSTKFDPPKPVDLMPLVAQAMMGQPVAAAPYTLDDMALDAVGLLDELGIDKAHIVGASMGGMIAQVVAAKHRSRTRSLVSIMSSSGNPALPPAQPAAGAALLAPRPAQDLRDACIRFGMDVYRAIGSPGYPPPEDELRATIALAFDRNYHPPGVTRQLLAVLANGSRVELLKTITAPTLVLHGQDDPLVPVEAGQDTARHVPGAKLETIAGWGHDLPTPLLPRLADSIASHCLAADAAAGRS